MRIVYMHGFASGPSSSKAQYFRRQFAARGVELEIPDLAEGAFERLTITGQLAVIERLVHGEPVSLMGSSMGGYLAALYASRHPEVQKLLLMAPAFYFPHRWTVELGEEKASEWKRTGKLAFYHYADNCMRDVGYQLIEDCAQYPDAPDFKQPAIIFHGTRDDVVPPSYSEEYAATHPNVRLRLVNSDHQLTEMVELIWSEASSFLV
jgi:uncharacterized protein